MIVGENCRAFVTILLAAAGIDAWPVLVNARLSSREIDDIRESLRCAAYLLHIACRLAAADHAKRHGAVVEGGMVLVRLASVPERECGTGTA